MVLPQPGSSWTAAEVNNRLAILTMYHSGPEGFEAWAYNWIRVLYEKDIDADLV